MKLTAAEVQKILTTDGRTKLFKEKLKKLLKFLLKKFSSTVCGKNLLYFSSC